MKRFLFFIALALTINASAQVTRVSLKASGLTCSMCSNSINKALKKLDFIEKIEADVKTYTFEISFKPNSLVDFDMIKNKVEGAGFAVAEFIAFIQFNKVRVSNNEPVKQGEMNLLFVNKPEPELDGIKEIKIINKGFASAAEYKKYKLPGSLPGTYYAVIN